MIKIELEEAFAFDLLAILIVKMFKCDDEQKREVIWNEALQLMFNIKSQIGDQLYYEIFDSEEFKNMIGANRKTFELVDLARNSDEGSLAKQVDISNMERFFCKKALQQAFFKTELKEQKL
jgi:hypothetical protein